MMSKFIESKTFESVEEEERAQEVRLECSLGSVKSRERVKKCEDV